MRKRKRSPAFSAGRPEALLTPEVVKDIRSWASEGFSPDEIRLQLKNLGMDLSYHVVYNVVKGNTYKEDGKR